MLLALPLPGYQIQISLAVSSPGQKDLPAPATGESGTEDDNERVFTDVDGYGTSY